MVVKEIIVKRQVKDQIWYDVEPFDAKTHTTKEILRSDTRTRSDDRKGND